MISIIVPVFNVEKYLTVCLDSIVNQTYSDFEVILVDDGSTDSSGWICDQYAAKDSRIRVIHQENQGLSPARNAGLRLIKGEYVVMIDSDDCVHVRFLEILYNLITSGDYNLAMCSFLRTNIISNTDIFRPLKDELVPEELSSNYCMCHLHAQTYGSLLGYVWNKLYRKEIIKDVYFKNDAAQDIEYNNIIFQRIDKCVFLNEQLYFYLQRPGSYQHRKMTRRHFDVLLTLESCLNDIPLEKKEYRDYCISNLYKR